MKKTLLILYVLPMLLLSHLTLGQTVVGEIKDSQGEPLAGATAVIKNTNNFAIAEANGQFSIPAPQKIPYSIQVKFVGFKTKEFQVTELTEFPLTIILEDDNLLAEIVVTSRRRQEEVQNVPIPISVLSGTLIAEAGAFNVNRLKELVPSVQLYSSNPRNTTLNIRGLGSTFGLTNDGIDPGVGFYVDGVYYSRPAVTTLDFIDVDQIEVLRGPQGTLFGKNTTAGAFNVTTRKASFTPGANYEVSFGNYGFVQAKTSITGPLTKKLAGRLSFSGTQRDGLIENVVTGKYVNDLNNLGFRGQLLYLPSEKTTITFAADASRQRPDGYAQVIAGVAPTLRAPYRQFEQIITDLNYSLPSQNAFDRKIDHDTPWRSSNDLGGISLNVDIDLGSGALTSITAWRYWNWNPSNDRDFTGLQGLALSQAPSSHKQWSQEIRWTGTIFPKLEGVIGLFAFGQRLGPDEAHTEEAGRDQWRFSQNSNSPLWQTPGLLEGYGIKTYPKLNTFSGSVFGQLDWTITERLSLLPGIRLNYDDKKLDFRRETYGGLQTEDPDLLALKRSVYSNQAFEAQIDDINFSGQLTAAYSHNERVNTFVTYATSFKPVGLNLGGLPNANGAPMLELAVVRPEQVRHFEIGIKTSPIPGTTLNVTLYNTDIKDFQTLVQTAELGVNRGYLSNAEKVRVRGAEVDASLRVNSNFSFYGAFSYTDGEYVSFVNAPVPLEETGGESAFKDISGGDLPGISKVATSLGGEFVNPAKFMGKGGDFFLAFDTYYRSSFSSSASPSKYLVVDGYALVNGRIGFRVADGMSISIWGRNLLDTNYFEQLLPGGGNAGHYAAVLGDQRTYGITIRQSF